MDEAVSSGSRQHRPWENTKYNSSTTQTSPTVSLAEIFDTAFTSDVDAPQNADLIIGINHCFSPKYSSQQNICR